MHIKFDSNVIVRTPQFPMNATLEDCWEYLKYSIKISSPDFYQEIAAVEVTAIPFLKERQKETIWKYFNRCRYRPTPFGTFATFGLLRHQDAEQKRGVKVSKKFLQHQFFNWPLAATYTYDFERLKKLDSLVQTNSTWYLVGDAIRYVADTENGFELSEVEITGKIVDVLNACKDNIKLSELYDIIYQEGTSVQECSTLIEDMIINGLLKTELDPNIIGNDYFDRVSFKPPHDTLPYVISERKAWGGIPDHLLRYFPALLNFLSLVGSNESITDDLKTFKTRFQQKFDLKEVPLMEALDPEIGVGYGDLELSGTTSTLLDYLVRNVNRTRESSLIKDKVVDGYDFSVPKGVVYLDDIKLPNSPTQAKLPANSISCVFSVSDSLVVLDQMGGYSVNQLCGRFSLASTQISDFCRDQAKMESEANEGVVFFDIAYISEQQVDNVNRRKRIYDYEASIMSYNTSENKIGLNDLSLRMSGNEVILYSKTLKKRVVPRMASAYNHRRTDLPVFKFLCDLMYHDINGDYCIYPELLVPGLPYYPRIQYRNIVIRRATWIIDSTDLSEHPDTGAFSQLLKSKNIPRFIRTGEADQTLVFDTENKQDLGYLFSYFSRKKSLRIEEGLLPDNCLVSDECEHPYYAQFIAVLNHKERVYFKSGPAWHSEEFIVDKFPPGSEWVSCEIYCHPMRADRILVDQLQSVLASFSKQIMRWFFIRYSENGHHIRFRIQLKNPQLLGDLLILINNAVYPLTIKGIVSDFQIKTYQREMERYGFAGIEGIEDLFYLDSRYVIELLDQQFTDEQKYWLCVQLVGRLRNLSGEDADKFNGWVSRISENLSNEHQFSGDAYKRINTFYKGIKIFEDVQLSTIGLCWLEKLLEQFTNVIACCNGVRKIPLITDIIHMHINRLFPEHQRVHETIIYNLYLLETRQQKGKLAELLKVKYSRS